MIRLLLFLFLFCVDVHVKADMPVASGSHKRAWDSGPLNVIMLPGSLLEPRDGGGANLVKGRFFVEFKSAATISTPFANVTCAVDLCQAILERTLENVEIKALRGDLSVRRLGDKQHYNVIAGARVAVSAVTPEGSSEMEFPQSLPWDSTVKQWAKFFPGTAKDFRPVLHQFREDWKSAVDALSRLHQTHAGRVIASYEKEQAEERSRRAIEERENAKLRQLFRERNSIGVQIPESSEPSQNETPQE